MPPKPKFTKDEIVATALDVVSENGVEALTAKRLGNALGSSASPLFTVFNSMKEIQDEVRIAAMHRFEAFDVPDMDELPVFKRVGMKMVFFAAREPKLFRLLFMQENRNAVSFDDIFAELGETAVECMKALQTDYALSEQDAKRIFENIWIYTFGVGVLCATRVCHFSEETLSDMLSQEFQALMLWVKKP